MKMLNNYRIHDQSGQAIVVILLVAVVGLTVGLSIAGTSIKNIQNTSTTEETNRAFNAAEAGIEEALLLVEQGAAAPVVAPHPLAAGSAVKNVQINSVNSLTLTQLAKDDVAQINLSCATCTAGDVRIVWDENTALVLTKISGSAPNYTVQRQALNCGSNPLFSGNGFAFGTDIGTKCEYQMAVDGSTDKVLRLRSMYGATGLSVAAYPSTATNRLPSQSTVVVATGQSGETERTVQVERSLPVPPAIFDYVLFSASGSLSKN